MRPVLDLLLTEPATDRRSWQAALGRAVSSVPIFNDVEATAWYAERDNLHQQIPVDIRTEWESSFGGDQFVAKTTQGTPFERVGNSPSLSDWWNTPTYLGAEWIPPLISTRGPWYGAPCVAAFGVEDDYIDRPWANETDPGESSLAIKQRDEWVPLAPRAADWNILEITGSADWVALVDAFPYPKKTSETQRRWWRTQNVPSMTASWFATESQNLNYAEPDWTAIAHEYDAVHVTIWGYLQTAYSFQKCATGFTTMIGWGPDFTVWLKDPR